MSWLGDRALSDTTTWGLVLGVVLPLVTAVVQQPRWTGGQRRAIAAAVSVLAGLLTCLANGSITQGQTVLATIAAVLVSSQATYRNLWKGAAAARIEHATSPKRKRRRPARAADTPR